MFVIYIKIFTIFAAIKTEGAGWDITRREIYGNIKNRLFKRRVVFFL